MAITHYCVAQWRLWHAYRKASVTLLTFEWFLDDVLAQVMTLQD